MKSHMPKVVKFYDQDDYVDVYFVDGERSLAYNDNSLLRELLGENFREVWIVEQDGLNEEEREMVSSIWSAEMIEEVEGILSAYPDLVEEEI